MMDTAQLFSVQHFLPVRADYNNHVCGVSVCKAFSLVLEQFLLLMPSPCFAGSPPSCFSQRSDEEFPFLCVQQRCRLCPLAFLLQP